MATINMNAVQFYNPSSTVPPLQKYRQATGIPHRKEWSHVLESYSQSQNAGEDIVGKQDDHASDGSIATDEDNEFPLVDEVIRRALHLEDSTKKPTNSALAAQGTNETFFLDGSGSRMPAQSNLSGHLGGSKDQPVILDDDDDNDDDNDDDDDDDDDNDDDNDNSDDGYNSTSGEGISSDLNAEGTSQELGPPPPPTTSYPSSRPSSSCDPSTHPSAARHDQSLEGQAIQQDDGCISSEMLEQASCPALILSNDKDDETEKGQQQQESGEGREQGARNSDTSSNGDIDDNNNHLQDSNKSEGLQPTKQRWLSPSCDPVIRRSHKQRLQRPYHGCLTNLSKLVRADLVPVRKETQQPSPLVSDDSDDSDRSEAPRPAKRRRPSPSNCDPTPNRSQRRRPQRPSESRSSSRSKLDRSHTASPQTQLKLSLNSDDCAQSQHSSTHSSTDDEQMSTPAEYREWPMHGFFKRTTIGNEIRYSMDFSLEQLQGLYAVACPLHAILPNSDREISTGPANLPKAGTRAKKARSAPASRSKRTPFTSKENAILVDLKENKGWPWKRIESKFPQRTLNSLQVHYCTKLKGKLLTEGDESM